MAAKSLIIPSDTNDVILRFGAEEVRLTNLQKLFWKNLKITKRDLLQYYADIAPWLLPHLAGRAMVMKRYPNGAEGEFFYMKRAPSPRPEWIEICSIPHGAGPVDFPIVQDLPSLLWLINLGCIDLNQWYARCDDVDRPDYLHFDLDPVGEIEFATVREAAGVVNETLRALGMPTFVKTTGSRGLHVYVPIVRGPTQKQVWEVSKTIALDVARRHPGLLTAVYKKAALQPERLGTHAGVDLLRPPDAVRRRVDASDVGGDRAGDSHRGLPHRQRSRAREGGRGFVEAGGGGEEAV